jgi:protein-L-isoaspartate(D-aspartate) O-methyltransferase
MSRQRFECMAASPSRYERTRCFRRGWALERAGWLAMAVVAAAAAVGLFGDGWISDASASAGDSLTVAYPHFARSEAPFEVTVDWSPRGQEAGLWIERSYLEQIEIEEIRPAPAAVRIGRDRIHYVFEALEAETRVRVTFRLEPQHAGAIRGRIGADDDLAVEVRHLVFP